jgi:hypothetical protein
MVVQDKSNTKISKRLGKVLFYLAYAPLMLLPLSLYTIFLFPLFPDEIATRPYLSRLPYDFPYRASGVGVCYSDFYQAIPSSHFLPGSINWLIHGLAESPTTLRLIGIFIFISWISCLAIYFIKKVKELNINIGVDKVHMNLIPVCVMVSLLFVGVLPFFLVMNRNEQLFFPAVILLIFVSISGFNSSKKYSLISKIILTVVYVVASSLLLYGHGKGLFLTPFILIIGWSLSKIYKKSVFVFILIFTGLLFSSTQAYIVWTNLYACTDYLAYDGFLKSFAIKPMSIINDTNVFFEKIYLSLIRSEEYLQHMMFKTSYQWDYLPGQKNGILFKIINFLITTNTVAIFIGSIVLSIFYYIRDINKGRYLTVNFSLFILLLCLIINALFNLTKNFYDAHYFYIAIIIVFIILIAENALLSLKSKVVCGVIAYLGIVSLLSQFLFIKQNTYAFMNGFTGPGIQIGRYEKNKLHETISEVSKTCNIDPINSEHVVTDDLTYGFFRKSHGPISYTYIFIDGRPNPLNRLINNIDVGGFVVDCNLMNEELRIISTQKNGICCISKDKIIDVYSSK